MIIDEYSHSNFNYAVFAISLSAYVVSPYNLYI